MWVVHIIFLQVVVPFQNKLLLCYDKFKTHLKVDIITGHKVDVNSFVYIRFLHQRMLVAAAAEDYRKVTTDYCCYLPYFHSIAAIIYKYINKAQLP